MLPDRRINKSNLIVMTPDEARPGVCKHGGGAGAIFVEPYDGIGMCRAEQCCFIERRKGSTTSGTFINSPL